MSANLETITISVDAFSFNKRLGERIKQDEMLGQRGGQDVTAPFDALLKAATYNPINHMLEVTLLREETTH